MLMPSIEELGRDARIPVMIEYCHTDNSHADNSYPKAFRLAGRSLFVFASGNCDWLNLMTSLILPNRRYCLQKQMKIELQVEMTYLAPIMLRDASISRTAVVILFSLGWTLFRFIIGINNRS